MDRACSGVGAAARLGLGPSSHGRAPDTGASIDKICGARRVQKLVMRSGRQDGRRENAESAQLALSGRDFDLLARADALPGEVDALRARLAVFAAHVRERLGSMDVSVESAELVGGPPGASDADQTNARLVVTWTRAASVSAALEVRMRELAIEGAPSSTDVSAHAEAPTPTAPRLLFWLGATGLGVGFEIPTAATGDLRSARARLESSEAARELTRELSRLPEQFRVGPAMDPSASDPSLDRVAYALERDELAALIERGRGLALGWAVPRDIAVAHEAILSEQLEDALVSLAPLYRMLTWAADNDWLELGREVWPRSRESVHASQDAQATPAEFDVGATVRVLRGPMAGRRGVIQEIDAKGEARVSFGLLATRIDGASLELETDERPRRQLSSSHRKLVPGR